jgi:hypothetical protein
MSRSIDYLRGKIVNRNLAELSNIRLKFLCFFEFEALGQRGYYHSNIYNIVVGEANTKR